MKKLTQITAVFMICAMLLASFSPSAAAQTYSGECGFNVTWSFNSYTGVLTISGEGMMDDYFFDTTYSIMQEYNNPAPWLIHQSNITNVVIDYGVTYIGSYAFYGLYNLTSITIPRSVDSIGSCAFYGLFNLTSVTIPDSVTDIGYSAFGGCYKITDISLPDTITHIGADAFSFADYYNSEKWDGGLLYLGNYLIDCDYEVTGDVTIREGTRAIADNLFAYRENITSVTIPDSIKSIGEDTFKFCSGLTSITIPGSVTSIGDWAFADCTGLTSITIPDSVTTIGSCAFYGCTSLASITIPDSVTRIRSNFIEDTAYYNNASNWDGKLLYVNNHLVSAKEDVSGTAQLRPGTKSISDICFSGRKDLTAITIPDSVDNIGSGAFEDCNSLKDVYYEGSTADKDKISISFFNDPLTDATWHYNSSNPFSDVQWGVWYTDPVLWAVKNNVTTGTTKTTFSPDYTCSRSEIITFLWRAYGKPEPAIENPFTDVKESDFYYAPALWAYENGMVSGTEFGGAVPCKRAEAVTFMWKAEGKAASEDASATFTDVTPGEEYAYAVGWALDKKVTTGTTATTFSPDLTCTRAQIVTFLYRYKA